MKRFTAAVGTLLFGLGFSLAPLAEISVRDDLGNNLVLEQPARRIISLAPNITEVLFYIGAGEQIVGADEYSNYPAAAQQIPRVNNHAAANYELILSLPAGCGESPGSPAMVRKSLSAFVNWGFPSLLSKLEPWRISPDFFRVLGALTGHADFAQSRAADFTRRLNALRGRIQRQAQDSYLLSDMG